MKKLCVLDAVTVVALSALLVCSGYAAYLLTWQSQPYEIGEILQNSWIEGNMVVNSTQIVFVSLNTTVQNPVQGTLNVWVIDDLGNIDDNGNLESASIIILPNPQGYFGQWSWTPLTTGNYTVMTTFEAD